MDEASQVGDKVASLFLAGYRELPQKPVLVIAADYQQLREVGHSGSKSAMQVMSEDLETHFHLTTNYRTEDEDLKSFLQTIRTRQPARSYLRDFFGERHLSGVLRRAVWWTLSEEKRRGTRFTWLCVTHKRGVQQVNTAALLAMDPPITDEQLEAHGYPGDPAAHAGPIILRPGLRLRLSAIWTRTKGR